MPRRNGLTPKVTVPRGRAIVLPPRAAQGAASEATVVFVPGPELEPSSCCKRACHCSAEQVTQTRFCRYSTCSAYMLGDDNESHESGGEGSARVDYLTSIG